MIKIKSLFLTVSFLVLCCFSHSQGVQTDLLEITQIKEGVKSKRISSYDQTGGNKDRIEHIQPGEKKIIFDVQGSGFQIELI